MSRFLMVASLAALLAVPASAPAQEGPREAQHVEAVRQAAALEAGGRFADARDLLEDVLEEDPGFLEALVALERVLRPLDQLPEVLPRADRLLEVRPDATAAWYLKLRVLVESDSVSGVEAAVEDWLAVAPGSAEPYREGARVLAQAGRPEAALDLLRRGRRDLQEAPGLLSDLGVLLLERGDTLGAAEAWAGAVGEDGRGTDTVLQRLAEVPDGPVRVTLARSVVEHLRGDARGDRGQAALRVALMAGLVDEATEGAEMVLSGLEEGDRRGFLAELAATGRDIGMPAVETWALLHLREEGGNEREWTALDERLAEVALAAGDTATALAARARVVQALPTGSAERRRAAAELLRAQALQGDPADLTDGLEAFRTEFPDAPEIDGLTAEVAAALRGRGDHAGAVRILSGVQGPRTSLERGYLLLEDGDVSEGRRALSGALPGLRADAATEVLQLVSLLDRLGAPAAALVGRTAATARRGGVREALEQIEEGLATVPEGERAALLAHGARLAESGELDGEAARLRQRLVENHPEAPERGEATLALARYKAGSPEDLAEAVSLLEDLIVERPQSPVVPSARRMLEELRREMPGDIGEREEA